MKMMYIKSDLKRALQIKSVCIGSIGIVLVMFFSIYKMVKITSVYQAYTDAVYFIPFMMAMTFCAIPFGGATSEDVEYKFFYMLLLRGSIRKYVASKVIVTYISAIVTMVIGVFGFVILVHFSVPWQESIAVEDGLLNILGGTTRGMLYFGIHSFFMGLLAADLVMVSVVLSLFWPNKLLQMSMPFMLYYVLIYYCGKLFPGTPGLNIQFMFNLSYNTWNNQKISFVLPIIISIAIAIVMGICMKKQLVSKYEK